MLKKILVLAGTITVLSSFSMAASEKIAVTAISPDVSIMPVDPYEITQQRYVYTGELPSNISDFGIYKGVNAMLENEKVKEVITSMKIDQFDLSQLQNTTLTNVTLKENKENGFRVTLDFEGGYLSVYRDYSNNYYRTLQNNQSNIQRMSDEEALKIAKDYIAKYKINVSQFGEPYVEAQPTAIAYSSTMSNYVDPYIQVVFPTKIDGKNVNERYGQNAGLRLSVSNQDKNIQGFSLKVEKVEKSNEAKVISDSTRIKDLISKGGYDYTYDYGTGYTVKYQDIQLTNPRTEYVKVDTYVDGVNTYYGPAIVFDTVKSNDPNVYVQDKVIVPLLDKAYETYK